MLSFCLFVPLVRYVFHVFSCLKEIPVETECPQKTTTVIPKLGVIKLLHTLNFDLLPAFILIFLFIVAGDKKTKALSDADSPTSAHVLNR